MKIGQTDVARLDWFGVKARLARALASPLVNPLVRFAANNILPASVGRRLPLALRHVTYRLADGQTVRLLEPSHDIVARDIYWGGSKPTSMAEVAKLRCIEQLSKRASTFVDIGAYGGVCALIAARSNSQLRAIAFEIVPENHLLLVRNIVENDLATRVEGRLCGIGATRGTVRLPASIGLASHPTSMSIGSHFSEGVSVNVTPLEEQLHKFDAPFFLKIDVEGYEREVIEGAAPFIAAQRPDIICEVLPDADEACVVIAALLEPLGYRYFMFDESGIRAREQLLVDTTPRDWLLTTRTNEDEFLGRQPQ